MNCFIPIVCITVTHSHLHSSTVLVLEKTNKT